MKQKSKKITKAMIAERSAISESYRNGYNTGRAVTDSEIGRNRNDAYYKGYENAKEKYQRSWFWHLCTIIGGSVMIGVILIVAINGVQNMIYKMSQTAHPLPSVQEPVGDYPDTWQTAQ